MAFLLYRTTKPLPTRQLGSRLPPQFHEEDDYNSPASEMRTNELVRHMTKLKVGDEKKRYGYFKCPSCHKRWESARTWCVYKGKRDGKKVFKPTSKQACKECKIMTLPEETKPLRRPELGEVRHVDPRRAHKRELCSRCRDGLPCSDEDSDED
ncbi:ZAR1 [Bugula neritina]|uniref:ZAR1 n=1 Tax=Bugula neritina TaxID=10212 RepID=A0A7J7KEH4_BUGNE|nr:ZAR1 [Bugula neritina]